MVHGINGRVGTMSAYEFDLVWRMIGVVRMACADVMTGVVGRSREPWVTATKFCTS